jgi:hypothetical protein
VQGNRFCTAIHRQIQHSTPIIAPDHRPASSSWQTNDYVFATVSKRRNPSFTP